MIERGARASARPKRWWRLAAAIAAITVLSASAGRASAVAANDQQVTGVRVRTALASVALALAGSFGVLGLEEVGAEHAYEAAQTAWQRTTPSAETQAPAGADPFYRQIGPFLQARQQLEERALQAPLWPQHLFPCNNGYLAALRGLPKALVATPSLGNAREAAARLNQQVAEAGAWRKAYTVAAHSLALAAGAAITSAALLARGGGGRLPAPRQPTPLQSSDRAASRRGPPHTPAGAH